MSKRIAFDVDPDIRIDLEAYAKARGVSLSNLAREALFEFVRRRKVAYISRLKALQRVL